jgi:serine/threonine protein kinase
LFSNDWYKFCISPKCHPRPAPAVRRPGDSYMQATQKIKGYDSFEQIALGGMAAVYKARKISLGKPVAIKVLFPHLAQDAVYIERFKREAQTAARVQHDNIVNVIDYGESDGAHYIVMEYYDGVTLEHLLETHTAIPIDICLAVVLNVCYGMEAAHASNLVHRDIKPGNIIFTRNGGLKLADFGLAKMVDKPAPVTQHGKIIGTPAYMSPEQTRGDTVGPQSDIFSLGVVAYELLCNCRPFDGRNYAEVVDKIQSADPTPVTDINPLVDPFVAKVISRMLAKDQRDRYEHVSEIVMDLEEAIEKAKYKKGRRVLEKYVNDPIGYLQSFKVKLLERLRSGKEKEVAALPPATRLRRIIYLDPDDERAREELAQLDTGAQAGAAGETAAAVKGKPKGDKVWVIDDEDEPGRAVDARADVAMPDICDDPDAEYRVYLESIDLHQETPATFALKLSMRIRSPLPRVVAIIKNLPAVVGGHLKQQKALRLAKVIRDLGGVARIEVQSTGKTPAPPLSQRPESDGEAQGSPHRPDKGKRKSRTEPEAFHSEGDSTRSSKGASGKADPNEVGDASARTVEYHPINQKRDDRPVPQKTPTRLCPRCGWEEDADAKFCSICMFNFHKTAPLDLESLSTGVVIPNPQARGRRRTTHPTNLRDWFNELPNTVKYVGLAGLVLMLLLIIFGR